MNLKSVKRIAETNFELCLIDLINAINFHGKEYLQIFYISLQFVCKLRNQYIIFSILSINSIMGKLKRGIFPFSGYRNPE